MTYENYIVIAVGIIALICGPLIVRNRVKIFDFFSVTLRALGAAPGRAAVKGSSPFWVGFTGAGLTFIGVVAFFAGIFAREL